MKVLIADDDRQAADCMAEFVKISGHEPVATVTTGGIAVLHAFDRTRPDLVLMDVMMPKVNGLTVCHALTSRPVRPKIVFLSGKVEPDHPFVTNAHADAFLAKPISLEAFQKMMNRMAEEVVAA
jgi:two-component system response regulator MprA